jgi:hypothetical protein
VRSDKRADTLLPEYVQSLEALGFDWVAPFGDLAVLNAANAELYNELWEKNFQKLCKYKAKYGDCNVLRGIDWQLANFVDKTRIRKEQLPQERIDKLNSIGFSWNPLDERWENNFQQLCKYKAKHGDCNVPYNYVDRKLAKFVGKMKERKNAGKLSPEREARLNAIGFIWSVRRK